MMISRKADQVGVKLPHATVCIVSFTVAVDLLRLSHLVYQVLGPVVHQWLDGSKMVSGCRKVNMCIVSLSLLWSDDMLLHSAQ